MTHVQTLLAGIASSSKGRPGVLWHFQLIDNDDVGGLQSMVIALQSAPSTPVDHAAVYGLLATTRTRVGGLTNNSGIVRVVVGAAVVPPHIQSW